MVSRIKANGIDVNYRLEGLKDGPVVMLSNSLMSNYTMWDDQIEALTSKFRVLRYDQRGHGGTQITPGPYSVELLAEDASALIEVLDLGPVHFVGLSMGGFTGQVLAVKYPEKISSLTLCDTACVMPPESVWNERIEMAGNEGLEALVDGTLERWFTPPFHQTGKEKIEKVRAMILATDVDGFTGCAQAIRDMFLCDKLSEITVPTLVLVGEGDPGCPVSAAEVLSEGISGAHLIIIPQSAHLPNVEQPVAFNEVLMQFLEGQQPVLHSVNPQT